MLFSNKIQVLHLPHAEPLILREKSRQIVLSIIAFCMGWGINVMSLGERVYLFVLQSVVNLQQSDNVQHAIAGS